MLQQASSSATTPTAADVRETFGDVTCDLGIGIKTLISHLQNAFDAGFELELEVGADVMDAIIAAQWIAQRLCDDIRAVGREFDGTRSEATEASR